MKRPPNKPIGTAPCPLKGCEARCEVFRYREYSDDQTRRRFAGKLYCQCAKHGRVDADQEYILENGDLWRDGIDPRAADASADASATHPAPAASAPKEAPVPAVKAPAQSTSKAQASAAAATRPADQTAEKTWGFL